MHEMSIARSIFEIVKGEVERHRVQQVMSIRLRVGALTGIVPDSLRFCFAVLAEHSAAETAELKIETTPVQASCKGCEHSFPVANCDFLCPRCGSGDIRVTSGRELLIEGMEVR